MAQGSAINDIFQMRQQGLSNNQIIQNLQRAGYTNTQIFDAMNQADTKMAVEGLQPGRLNYAETNNTLPPSNNSQLFTQAPVGQPSPAPQHPAFIQSQEVTSNMPSPEPEMQQPMPFQQSSFEEPSHTYKPSRSEEVKIEELVEAIIEEKWSELVKDVNKIVDWKNKIESKVNDLDIKLDNLKDNFSDLNRAVIGKVNDYDRHILEIGTDLKAMEKVFSKVLPKFTENVNELTKIADKMKPER